MGTFPDVEDDHGVECDDQRHNGDPERGERGGEAACWLHLLCDECGAVLERGRRACWRCPAPAVGAEGGPGPGPDAERTE